MIKNTFVVNTQLHLLIAQSLIKQLKLAHCALVMLEGSDFSSSKLFEEVCFDKIVIVPKFDKKQPFSFRSSKHLLNDLAGSNLFWGNDYQIENQFIAKKIKPGSISLFDDGIASYMQNIKPVSLVKKLFMAVYSAIFLDFSMKNKSGVGAYSADHRFILSDKVAKETASGATVIQLSYPEHLKYYLQEKLNALGKSDSIALYLTQPISEFKVMSAEEENELLEKLSAKVEPETDVILIKSHPAECIARHQERLAIIKQNTQSKVVVIEAINDLPVEAIVALADKCHFKQALSLYSTAIVTLKLLESAINCQSGISEEDSHRNNSFLELYELFKRVGIKLLEQ